MRIRGLGVICCLVLATAGCAPPGQPTAAPAPGAFDGTYRGTLRLTRNADGQCGDAVIQRTVTVANSHARIVYNPSRGRAAVGTVRPDGSFTLVGETSGSVEITGRIEGDALTGRFNSDICTYEVALRKAA